MAPSLPAPRGGWLARRLTKMLRDWHQITGTARTLLRVAKVALLFVADSFVCFPVRRRAVALVVRLDSVGDFFIWLQSGAADVARFARRDNCRTILLANRAWADYARRLSLWDDVVDLDPERLSSNPIYRFSQFVRIRMLGAAMLVQPRSARTFLVDDAISRISGARPRIANAGSLLNTFSFIERFGNRFYDRLIRVDQSRDVHETTRNSEFVEKLTGRPPAPYRFAEIDRKPKRGRVVIVLGAGWVGRRWPLENLSQLIRYIIDKYPKAEILLAGVTQDLPLAQRLNRLVGKELENRLGQTTLQQLVELIATAELVISNDSAAYHIAVALRRKVICFLGGGHYGWFAPYPESEPMSDLTRVLSVPMECFWCNWQCRYPRAEDEAVYCVRSISVQAAIDAVDALLIP
ncbi:MAG: glycosyltransferase family 9 protein [Steroidobacterales bacterium]